MIWYNLCYIQLETTKTIPFYFKECITREINMNIKMLKAAVAGLVLSVSGFANAGLIYDNGVGVNNADTGYYTSNVRSFQIYDDFTLASDSTITDVFFQMGLTSGNFDGSFSFTIFNFLAGSGVGAQLYTQTLNSGDYSASLNSISSHPSGPFYDINFDIPSLDLSAGNYELSFYGLGMDFRIPNVSSGNGFYQNSSFISGDTPFALFDNSVQVPEPSTLAIFALGIMGLASRRFKK
ncbi:MAG: hypothetical protein ACJA1K_000161 [Cognaticolwellia sp.]|jgi:hypothetical protein